MSMIRCERCGDLIDSDNDLECFTEIFVPAYGENGGYLQERVLCIHCRPEDD